MPILNRPSGGGNKIKGIEYEGIAKADLYKNQLCYVNGGGNSSPLGIADLYYPINTPIDKNRILLIGFSVPTASSSNQADLVGVILTYNNGDDKLTKPFQDNWTKKTLVSAFQSSIVDNFSSLDKFNHPSRNLFIYRYYNKIYILEVVENEINIVTKGSYPEIVVQDMMIKPISLFSTLGEDIYYFSAVGCGGTNRNTMTAYCFSLSVATGRVTSVVDSQKISITEDSWLLGIFPIDESGLKNIVVHLSRGTKIVNFYYLSISFTQSSNNTPTFVMENLVSVLDYTLPLAFSMPYCTYKNGLICLSCHSYNNTSSYVFLFEAKLNTNNNSATVTFKKQNQVSLLNELNSSFNVILNSNTICVYCFDSEYNLGYYLYDFVHNNNTAIKNITTLTSSSDIGYYLNNKVFAHNDMVYFIYYGYFYATLQIPQIATVLTVNNIYPLTSLSNVDINSIGLSQDDYVTNQTALIIHPTS